jgi:cyclophilin family peptidyl-prolyl cis-trans isomerase
MNSYKSKIYLVLVLGVLFLSTGAALNPKPTYVEIITRFGVMKVKLYDETPLHRDNFLKLVKAGYYDSLTFFQIFPDYTIQSGDPKSRYATEDSLIGDGGPTYKIPAEFRPNLIHKYGALAAARDINPDFSSHGSQFYIVKGKKFTVEELQKVEGLRNQIIRSNIFYQLTKADTTQARIKDFSLRGDKEGLRAYTKTFQAATDSAFAKRGPYQLNIDQIRAYTSIGGLPQLDSGYTVFGEVVKGLNIIDYICAQPRAKNNRPIKDIRIKIRVVQIK